MEMCSGIQSTIRAISTFAAGSWDSNYDFIDGHFSLKYYPAHPLDLVSTIRSVDDRKPCRPSFLDQVAFRDLDRGSGRAMLVVPINI